MRATPFAMLLACGLLTGCIQAGIEAIEESRADRRAREDESTELPEPYGPPTPPWLAEPTPRPSPTPGPISTPSPTPSPSPTPTPTPSPSPSPRPSVPWPREGSYVRYEVDTWSAEGRSTRVWANWTYEDDDWVGRCEGLARDVVFTSEDPPHWPLFDTRDVPDEGAPVRVWYLWECAIARGEAAYSGFDGGRHAATRAPPAQLHTEWDAATGLVLGWDIHDEGAGGFGRVTLTDAPLASRVGYVAPHG